MEINREDEQDGALDVPSAADGVDEEGCSEEDGSGDASVLADGGSDVANFDKGAGAADASVLAGGGDVDENELI